MTNFINKYTTLFKPNGTNQEVSESQQSLSTDTLNYSQHLFSLLDPNSTGHISFNALISLLTNARIKPYNINSYNILYNKGVSNEDDLLDFSKFVTLVQDLKLSDLDLKILAPIECQNAYGASDLALNKGAFSQKRYQLQLEDYKSATKRKQECLTSTFNNIEKQESNKLSINDLSSKAEDLTYEYLQKIFRELDCTGKGFLVADDVIKGLRTKLGTLCTYNMIIYDQNINDSNKVSQQSKLINLEDFKEVSDGDILDLLQAFELLDVEAKAAIKPYLLSEHEQKISNNLNNTERKALDALLEVSEKSITFQQFVDLFRNGSFTLSEITGLAKKFDTYWRDYNNEAREKMQSMAYLNTDEDKSPLYSTAESFQGSLQGRLSPEPSILSNKRQFSALSVSDRKKNVLGNVNFEPLDVRSMAPSLPELKPYNDTLEIAQDKSSQGSSNVPCSLESLTEDDPGSANRLIITKQIERQLKEQQEQKAEKDSGNSEEKAKLKDENVKLKEDVQAKATEILCMQKRLSDTKEILEIEQSKNKKAVETVLVEKEETLKKLETAALQIKKLEFATGESDNRLRLAIHEASKMKRKLAEKVKESLMFKEKMDAIEKKLREKTRDVEDVSKKQKQEEKNHKDAMDGLKTRITYLTQKFREYLTQNTELQSELHEKEGLTKKMQTELREHNIKSENERVEKDKKIVDLEKQLKRLSSRRPDSTTKDLSEHICDDCGLCESCEGGASPDVVAQDLLARLDEALKFNECEQNMKEGLITKMRSLSEEVMRLGKSEDVEKAPEEVPQGDFSIKEMRENIQEYLSRLRKWESKVKTFDDNIDKDDDKKAIEKLKLRAKESSKVISANIRLFNRLEKILAENSGEKNESKIESRREIERLNKVLREKNVETDRLNQELDNLKTGTFRIESSRGPVIKLQHVGEM